MCLVGFYGFSRGCTRECTADIRREAPATVVALQPRGKVCAARGLLWGQNLFILLVDFLVKPLYNTSMENKTTRKTRVDRNHIIYELRVPGGNYVGVTAKTESTVNKSVRARAAKHFYRARSENKEWTLCVELRKLASKDDIEIVVHEIVRGKADAHRREVELRRTIKPTLNTDRRGD